MSDGHTKSIAGFEVGRRLNPSHRAAVIKPLVRKTPPPDKDGIFRPLDYLFIGIMKLSKIRWIAAQIRMVPHGLFAVGGFYLALKAR